jgi:hypothetical protein
MIGRDGFGSSNRFRKYPFRSGTSLTMTPDDLPESVITDFCCLLGPESGYDATVHRVWLGAVERDGDTFTFDFETDAPGMVDQFLRFERDLSDARHCTSRAEALYVGLEDVYPHWMGYLTTGDLDELAALLGDGDSLFGDSDGCWVEPVLVQALDGLAVSRVNVWNSKRLTWNMPAGCDGSGSGSIDDSEGDELDHLLFDSALAYQPLFIEEGYNAIVHTNPTTNSLIFTARVGAGWGEVDSEVPLYEGEEPLDDSRFLAGGLACDEVIQSVNAATGPDLVLEAGRGILIVPDQDAYTIDVYLDLSAVGKCGVLDPADPPTLDPFPEDEEGEGEGGGGGGGGGGGEDCPVQTDGCDEPTSCTLYVQYYGEENWSEVAADMDDFLLSGLLGTNVLTITYDGTNGWWQGFLSPYYYTLIYSPDGPGWFLGVNIFGTVNPLTDFQLSNGPDDDDCTTDHFYVYNHGLL